MQNRNLVALRNGEPLSFRRQVLMILQLSLPAILAQLSTIIMEYIDASMVGRLGAEQSAAIGIVSSTVWLFGGVCMAAVTGFTVQVAQRVGAEDGPAARNLMKLSFIGAIGFSLLIGLLGILISDGLPHWLGGAAEICGDATGYLRTYSYFIPILQLSTLAGGLLQATGNMKLPSLVHIVMCLLDVFFNLLFIFPTRQVAGIPLPGLDLGVTGAALGTGLAELCGAVILLLAVDHSPVLRPIKGERFTFSKEQMGRAVRLALPIGAEQMIMCGAQIVSTRIVAPLGTVALAANSFAVTAEGLCYMPGYGIGAAATTLIGQSVGARRRDLTGKLGWISTCLAMVIMAVTGVIMYLFAPFMIGLLSPDPRVVELGASVLRIEALAEPLFAASIAATGVFRGAGDTLMPSLLNFISMWAIRLPVGAFLAPRYGLTGVWTAMCLELCIRGALFLIRLGRGKWNRER